jgi:hypothetical protein
MCWSLIIYCCEWNVHDPLFKNFDVILQISFNFLSICNWGFLLGYELEQGNLNKIELVLVEDNYPIYVGCVEA